MKRPTAIAALALAVLVAPAAASETGPVSGQAGEKGGASVLRGRYLVKIAGCNDCHTPGYMQSAGKVPEKQWLTGDALGYRGPWGTTYPTNLRLYARELDEKQWVTLARKKEMRPPMPRFSLRDMTDPDLRAIYRYIRHLGPEGKPAPQYEPPDVTPKGPHVLFPK